MNLRQKLFLFSTAALLLTSGSAMAFEDLFLPATNTLSAVKLELWANGVEHAEVDVKEAQIPEEVTLGLEKWQSSL